MSALRNSVLNLTEALLSPLLFLITTPFFIHHIGVGRFGLWVMANAIAGLTNVLSLGVADATIKYVARSRATNDPMTALSIIRIGWTLTIIISMVVLTVGWSLAPLVTPWLMQIDPQLEPTALRVMLIALVSLAVRFLDAHATATLQGHHRYDLSSRATIMCTALTMAVNVTLAAWGFTIESILITVAIGQIVQLLIKLILIRGSLMSGWSFFTPTRAVLQDREILHYGFYSWIRSMGDLMLHQVDRFLVLTFLGAESLALYGTALQICSLIHLIPARMLAFTFPKVSEICERGDEAAMARLYRRGSIISSSVSTGVCLSLAAFSFPLLSLWVGPVIAAPLSALVCPLAIAYYLLASTIMTAYILTGSMFVRFSTLTSFASGLLVSTCSLVAVHRHSLTGVVWSRFANVPLIVLSRVVMFQRVIRHDVGFTLICDLVPLIAGLILIVVLHTVASAIIPTAPGALILLSGACAGGGALMVFLLGHVLLGERLRMWIGR